MAHHAALSRDRGRRVGPPPTPATLTSTARTSPAPATSRAGRRRDACSSRPLKNLQAGWKSGLMRISYRHSVKRLVRSPASSSFGASCQHGACAHHAAEPHDVVCASRGGLPPSRRAAGCASCHDSARPALTGGCHIACFHSSFCSGGQAGRAGRRARSRRPATMWIIKANLAGPARPKSLPRLAEALGSPRYDLALRRASSEPAGRGVSQR